MRVIIIGGGIIGALSAYYLGRGGASVTLLERADDLAAETSGMNGDQLSYSYLSPLGNPAIYGLLRKTILGGMEDVKVTQWLDPQLWSWGLRLFFNSSQAKYAAHQEKLLALSLRSRALMAAFLQEHKVNFDHAENGKLHLYTSPEQADTAKKFAARLAELGIEQKFLTPDQCLELEPALKNRKGTLAGGMLSPIDAVGDCGAFTRALPNLWGPNVQSRTGDTVKKIHVEAGKFKHVETEVGEIIEADACLVCAGAYSYQILKTAGIYVSLYPVKGYSVTLENSGIELKRNVTDHLRRAVFAPVGDKLRVAGFMHFSGYDKSVAPRTQAVFTRMIADVFPDARIAVPALASGFRPYTPQSTPMTGETRIKGLHVNIGHAMLGWTLAHATCEKAAHAILAPQAF